MKAMMQSMKRRFSTDSKKKELKPSAQLGTGNAVVKELRDWTKTEMPAVVNAHLPRHRRDRKIAKFIYQDLPPLDADYLSPTEKENLFVRKLRLCTYIFHFESEKNANNAAQAQGAQGSVPMSAPRGPDPQAAEKEVKHKTLMELIDYLSKNKTMFSEPVLIDLMEMISTNILRPLPPSSSESGIYDPEEDEPIMEAAWPHLQMVYEFLLRFISSTETDQKLMKKYMNTDFVSRLLLNFDSEDPRERDYLKTILHKIYGKFMPLRSFIRKGINNIFHRFIFESERHNGIAELLEILGSIINGFALPLKPEHKQFLCKVLLPLHKPKMMSMYHPQLSYCISQFIEKDVTLSTDIISGLLRFWPKSCAKKEVMFLNELEEIVERVSPTELERIAILLFKQIARCIRSSHFQVAERALYLLNNEHIITFVASHRDALVPLLFGALYDNVSYHWNSTVSDLTGGVIKLFSDMDPVLSDRCTREHEARTSALRAQRSNHSRIWDQLDAQTKRTADPSQSAAIHAHRSSISYGPLAVSGL